MRLLAEIVLVALAAGAVAVCLAHLPDEASARWSRVTVAPPPRPGQLVALERLVATSASRTLTAHAYLRPVLSEIASRRLATRGYSLGQMTESVGQELLGERLWELVRPDRPFPVDRYGPGVPVHELRTMLAVLEGL